MKMNKFFMLGLAGLAFAACSNEEEVVNDFPNGGGAVSIRLVNPSVSTKGLAEPSSNTVPITGTITIDLYDDQTTSVSQTMSFDASEIDASTVLTFWNVTAPRKITVSINNGTADYANVDITTLQDKLANIPAYGETTKFTLTDEMKSPNLSNEHDAATGTGNKHEQGANAGDDKKQYQIYTAKVTMAIPVARLEVSGIHHKSHPQQADPGTDECEYETLTIKGVYMDNLYTKGGAYQENNTSIGTDGFYDSKFANGNVSSI